MKIQGLTVQEVAERTGYSVGTIYIYSLQPRFPPPVARLGGLKFYDPESIDDWKRWHAGKDRRKRRRHK
jgi:predicted DNA-binding transcriptional regulator AlpA